MRHEPLRFSALRRACPPVSDRILTKELRELEAWGLVSREQYPVIPPKTEYRLTAFGNTLRPIMAAMADWGLTHRAALVDEAAPVDPIATDPTATEPAAPNPAANQD